jgi:hypothetical protein
MPALALSGAARRGRIRTRSPEVEEWHPCNVDYVILVVPNSLLNEPLSSGVLRSWSSGVESSRKSAQPRFNTPGRHGQRPAALGYYLDFPNNALQNADASILGESGAPKRWPQRSLSLLRSNLSSTCSKASGPTRMSPLNG